MRVLGTVLMLVVPAVVAAQVAPPTPTVPQLQQWFESGQYQQVIQAPANEDPKAIYLAAASLERLKRFDEARDVFGRLAARDETDPWGQIGRSAVALLQVPPAGTPPPPAEGEAPVDPLMVAEQAARRAIETAQPAPEPGAPTPPPGPNPTLAMAHYQLGLVQTVRAQNDPAAASFAAAASADPSFAYAHYFAGLVYSRINRVDQTGIFWTAFLQLAPKAPEAPQVLSIMRTLRGR